MKIKQYLVNIIITFLVIHFGLSQQTLFSENFELGNLEDWILMEHVPNAGTMSIVPGSLNGNGNSLLRTKVDNAGGNENDDMIAFYQPSINWSNYNISFDFELGNYTYNYMKMLFYYQDWDTWFGNGYRLLAAPTQNFLSLVKMENGVWSELANYSFNFVDGVPYHIDIIVLGNNIKIFIDDTLSIDIDDGTFRTGAFGLGVSNAGLESNRIVLYDNILCEIGSNENQGGCTNSDACNYNPNAIIDDGSCLYGDGLTDYDGNNYCTVTIGEQEWMASSLRVEHYQNGDEIPTGHSDSEWIGLSTGAYEHSDNNPGNSVLYGNLYNWYAVGDERNIAPEGWHIPTDEDWMDLEMYLGLSQEEAMTYGWRGTNEGGKLKSVGTLDEGNGLWITPNVGATNESGFTSLPAGYRNDYYGFFRFIGEFSYYWTSTSYIQTHAWLRKLENINSGIKRMYDDKRLGFSIRCVRDQITEVYGCTDDSACNFNPDATIDDGSCVYGDVVTDIDGNSYCTVVIGEQEWMLENLKVTHYRNGDQISTGYTDNEWVNLSTEAFTMYENDTSNSQTYGNLYNWYAVNDSRGIAPEDWRVASDEDFIELEMFLGMSTSDAYTSGVYRGSDEGSKLKEAGTNHWNLPNEGATNESGFTAIPGGWRHFSEGTYYNQGIGAYFWMSSEFDGNSAWSRRISTNYSGINRYYFLKTAGFSVRCVRDFNPSLGCTDSNADNYDPEATEDDGSCTGLDYGLVAYYPFNGDALDISGNGNDGTPVDIDHVADRFNIPESAFSFDGTGSRVHLNPIFSEDQDPLTYTGWFKLCNDSVNPNPGNNNSIYGEYVPWGATRNYSTVRILDSELTVQFDQYSPSGGLAGGSSIVEEVDNDIWFQVTIIKEDDIVHFYTNGELISSIPHTESYSSGEPTDAAIGARYLYSTWDNWYAYCGEIDDFRIYNRALSTDEILELYCENSWCIEPIYGCLDQSALNYCPDCNEEDDSCYYIEDLYIDATDFVIELPDDAFAHPSGKKRDNLSDKLSQAFDAYIIGDISESLDLLSHPILNHLTGNPNSWWVVDNNARLDLIDMINQLITAIEGELLTRNISSDIQNIPDNFSLQPAYPNPFNPVTTISYSLPTDASVSLYVYDIAGREVAELINSNSQQIAGNYAVEFDATDLSSGLYFVMMKANSANEEFISKQKVVLLK